LSVLGGCGGGEGGDLCGQNLMLTEGIRLGSSRDGMRVRVVFELLTPALLLLQLGNAVLLLRDGGFGLNEGLRPD
jgi:hypothetical protein